MKKLLTVIMFIAIFMVGMASSPISKDNSVYAGSTLVNPEMAKKMVESENDLVILDVRKREDFEKEHIEGSYQIWESDFSADKGEYKYDGMRAAPQKIAETLGSYGVTTNTHILLLGGGEGSEAYRLWWILDMYGHRNISMINGGIDGWKSAGLKVVEGAMAKPMIPAVYEFANSVDLSKSANLEEVKAAIADGGVILDTRTYLESDGFIQEEKIFAVGRIPGSYNIPWDLTIDKDKTFKSYKMIKGIFDEQGITKDMPIILYSRSGIESARMVFVLRELLGYKDVENYDGSWIQWSYELARGNVEIEKDNTFKVLFSYLAKREKLESVITMLGVWGPLAYILMYIFITLTISPALPITIAGGIIFGPVMGVVYTAIGAGIGLSLSFLIARYVAREAIERKFGNTAVFKKIDEGVKKDGWFILAVTRLIPIFPFGIQNYVYGLTSIGFIKYVVLSIIFILPGSSVYVMLAGAFTSGDKAIVLRYSITASLIFMGLMVVTKIIKKKIELQN
ncbi:rhodanese-like domain-containing protein [Fusobacteria bacterium ZRK30]|nr:rhodanese-like domain-containing protein [Fusobacteria bacterium ZRK30]